MNIPQEEIDKLNASTSEGLFEEHAEVEEEEVEEQPIIEKVEEKVSESPDEDSVGDKPRVPYSRFETVQERATIAETQVKMLEKQLAERQPQNTVDEENVSIPEEWTELYGDNESAKRAYVLQMRLNEKARQDAVSQITQDIENSKLQREVEEKANLEYIEQGIKNVEDSLGRKLTETEESALLDIQDEFTPKDDNGNYIAPLLSADKAFEVYTLRNSTVKAEKSKTRRAVVAASSSNSEGESSNKAFDNYRPGESGLWRSQL